MNFFVTVEPGYHSPRWTLLSLYLEPECSGLSGSEVELDMQKSVCGARQEISPVIVKKFLKY